MKKIILASALVASAGMTYAAGGALSAGSNSVTTSNCALLSGDVKITLSTGNVGYYDCNTTSSSIGLAVSNSSGKNKVYSLGSAGGKIEETTTASAITSGAGLQTYAEAKSASS